MQYASLPTTHASAIRQRPARSLRTSSWRPRVNSALTEEIGIGIAPTGIKVSAANGRITLMGTSSSGALRRKAEKVAHRVAGGCQIDNRIVSVPTRGSGSYAGVSQA